MNAIEPYSIKVLLVLSNWAFGHKELTPMICLSEHQTIASQSAIGQCPKQPSLNQVYMYRQQRSLTGFQTINYLQRSCRSDYIRHIHHAFIIIFETIHTGCCYGHTPRLARSPRHGTSFGWFAFLSSHPIPAHSFTGLYPSSGIGRRISPSLT